MTNFYFWRHACRAGRCRATAFLGLSLWLLVGIAHAQAPTWALATVGSTVYSNNFSSNYAMAADASGNIFVAGSFTGTVAFGTTTLTSAGQRDLYVAKYVPATNTWAWAQRGGGTQDDEATGLAVRGSSVYLTGYLTNNSINDYQVTLGSGGTTPGSVVVLGASTTFGSDLLVAKYTDQGTSAPLSWVQVAGGKANDYGYGIAATNAGIYVTGTITNNSANSWQVLFGGNGTTPGTVVQAGATTALSNDLVVAKYLDNGSSATVAWTQVAGGTDGDVGTAIAVSGANVYVVGSITNNLSNSSGVRFGGTGTVAGTLAQAGATATVSADLLVAKYFDDGVSPTIVWTQVGGGTDLDSGTALAVSGANVYVTGSIYNNSSNSDAVVFGGAGMVAGLAPQYGATTTLSRDLVVAKYTDNGPTGTFGWTQVGGGTGYDVGTGIAASGSSVYLTGWLVNNLANSNSVVFGGSGSTLGTVPVLGVSGTVRGLTDVLVAKYTDQGSTSVLSWTQMGGGLIDDRSQAIVLSGTSLYVTGAVCPPAVFGALSITSSPGQAGNFLASLSGAVLANTAGAAGASPRLYPNPAPGPATLSGAPAGTTVHIFDSLGRRVATAAADANGAAALPAGLTPGLYLVRAGASTVRWAVE